MSKYHEYDLCTWQKARGENSANPSPWHLVVFPCPQKTCSPPLLRYAWSPSWWWWEARRASEWGWGNLSSKCCHTYQKDIIFRSLSNRETGEASIRIVLIRARTIPRFERTYVRVNSNAELWYLVFLAGEIYEEEHWCWTFSKKFKGAPCHLTGIIPPGTVLPTALFVLFCGHILSSRHTRSNN